MNNEKSFIAKLLTGSIYGIMIVIVTLVGVFFIRQSADTEPVVIIDDGGRSRHSDGSSNQSADPQIDPDTINDDSKLEELRAKLNDEWLKDPETKPASGYKEAFGLTEEELEEEYTFVYMYKDDMGEAHFVDNLDAVPDKFVDNAERIIVTTVESEEKKKKKKKTNRYDSHTERLKRTNNRIKDSMNSLRNQTYEEKRNQNQQRIKIMRINEQTRREEWEQRKEERRQRIEEQKRRKKYAM